MKQLIINIGEIFMYLLNKIIPHNKRIWITGKTTRWMLGKKPPTFFDNSKYFFLYLSKCTDEIVYWLTSSKKEYDFLKSLNLNVVKYPSLKGLYLVFKSKYSFHHYEINQISYFFQKGSIQINLGHGMPLKKGRYDVIGKPVYKSKLMEKIIKSNNIEYVGSSSSYISDTILENAFDVDKDHMLNYGYPRTDVFKLNKEENYRFCLKYSPELIQYINICANKQKIFLYMPTFRDINPNYFKDANINFDKLNDKLSSNNSLMFIKLHPLTNKNDMENYSNIIFINNDVDIYPFLQYVDTLITDYSSIFYDFLLFDREIIFIPFDIKEYLKHREIYYDYETATPGKKYYSFNEFIDNIEHDTSDEYKQMRLKIRNKFIENYNYDACEKIYHHMINLK